MDEAGRFFKKVDRNGPNGCWVWKGRIKDFRSALFHFEGHYATPGRASWQLRHGAIHPGLVVDRTCGGERCVNPDHMVLRTPSERMREARQSGRCLVPPPEDVAKRFWEKVDRPSADECWKWKASRSKTGYGHFHIGRRTLLASRVAWELTHGPIPEGLCVCHKCDNPFCCNPTHLFLGTREENYRDMVAKKRTRYAVRGNAKLTEVQVRQIRREYIPWTMGASKLAAKFGVTKEAHVK